MNPAHNFYTRRTFLFLFWLFGHCSPDLFLGVCFIFMFIFILFIKAIKKCLALVWTFEKCASKIYGGLQNAHLLFFACFKKMYRDLWKSGKIAAPSVCAPQQCASRFYEGPKNMHLLFMSLSKMCIAISASHKKCRCFVRALQQYAPCFYEGLKKCASPFYVSFKISHHDIWRP